MAYVKSINQYIVADAGNSKQTALATGETFTGAWTTAWNISAIQTIFYANQPCTIYIDQGQDGTNVDVTDSFSVLASVGDSRVILSAAPYYRIRVTNTGEGDATVFRLTTGQTPIVNPMPRTLSQEGNFQVANRENMPNVFTTGTITEIGGTVVTEVEGYKSAGVVITGTWTGTLVWEISSDDQATWSSSSLRGGSISGAGGGSAFPASYSSITANGTYKINSTGGVTHMRLRATTAITGTVNVRITHTDAKHLFSFTSSQIVQNVVGSLYNDSSGTLAGGASFTGTGETTLGVAGIQVNVWADQVCRVQVQQSTDNLTGHWDISDEFTVAPNEGDSRTFQATASYFRVILTNVTGTTANYRLQTALCPIVEAVPRALTQSGNLKVAVEEAEPVSKDFVINQQFFNSYLDEYNWYRTNGSGGTVTPSPAYIALTTTTDSASNSSLYSKLMISLSNDPQLVACFLISYDQPSSLTNNTRRWGILSAGETDGMCFELKDGVMYATVIANGSSTRVSIDGFKPTDGATHEYELEASREEMAWSIDKVVVYRLEVSSIPAFTNQQFHIWSSNVNSGVVGNTSYIRMPSVTLCDESVNSVRLHGGDGGIQANVSIDNYLRVKGYGSVLFSELFPDNTLDTTNKWTEAIVSGGSKSVSGSLLTLAVTTASGASITENGKQSVLTAAGQSMTRIAMVVNLGTVFDDNNTREWGTKTGTNGFFFRQVGQNTYAVRVDAGSETQLALPALTDGRIHSCEIVRTGLTDAWFYVDRERVGAMHGTTSALTASKYDTAWLANYNTGVSANPINLVVSAHAIVEDSSQSIRLVGADQNGLQRNVITNENGSLRITNEGLVHPPTTEVGEARLLREYVATYEYSMASAATEYPIIFLKNPNGSGKVMYIHKIVVTGQSAAAGRSATVRVYYNPTTSNDGSALARNSMYIGGGAAASVMTAFTVPTVSVNGTQIGITQSLYEGQTIDYKYGLLLGANNTLLITGRGSANTTLVGISVFWTECSS